MSFREEWIRYGRHDTYTAYVARPERAMEPLPAIVVIQEIWGVDGHIQDVTRRFAKAGYVAVAPDLYARDGSRPQALQADRVEQAKRFLDTLPPGAWGNAALRDAELAKLEADRREQVSGTLATLFGGLQTDLYIGQLTETAAFLRADFEPTKGQSTGSVGFCMGGALSVRLACHDSDLKAAVIFYGSAPDTSLIGGISAAVRGFYGGLDHRISDAAPAFALTMKSAGKDFAYEIYEGAEHAFFNDSRRSYNARAARDAWAQTLQFFNERLGVR